jgi:hypothetical protein
MHLKYFYFIVLFNYISTISAQNNNGEIHGNFQIDGQYYRKDTATGAKIVPEKLANNGFFNLIYTKENFSCGLRYENYLFPLQGFDTRYKGQGIPYRFATYAKDGVEVTAGNFYEQFGSGMLLRTYEERNLGYDNVFDGLRVKYNGVKGLVVKGLVAKQRDFFVQGPGIVRAFDAEVALNEIIKPMKDKKGIWFVAASYVSKYQEDKDPSLNLPENVAAGGGRIKYSRPINKGLFTFSGEYCYKVNDPSAINKYNYKFGEGLLLNAAYSQKGFGLNISAKRIDNLNFRSDRNANNNSLMINFLPALTRQHTYNLAATIYPYATQPNGEMALQADLTYTFKKETPIGGKYGTTIGINFSQASDLYKTKIFADSTYKGYASDFIKTGNIFFKDVNIEITKKLSPKLRMIFMYAHFEYNQEIIQNIPGKPRIFSNIQVLELDYKFSAKHALRTELQALQTTKDLGSWAAILLEYTISPNYFFAFVNQFNYGNPLEYKQIQYPLAVVGYTHHANRFSLSYGRQRAGIFCVGGVCRLMPAATGLTLSVTSSF